MNKRRRIFLIGLMGSGKTFWGEKIAALLHWRFIDLDRFIEQHEQMSIREIFEKHGEMHFRQLEGKYLKQMQSLHDIVIAAGGGTPCFANNMDEMNRMGQTYYFKVKPETAAERLKNHLRERPLLHGKNESNLNAFFKAQLKEREPFYLKAAHVIDAENLREEDLKALFTTS